MNLIDKDALVTEIKRYKHKADERLKIKGRSLAEDCKDSALQNLCGNLLHFIDTLEVKEDNLLTEKVIERELAEAYINVFDKKYKLPKLKGKQLHDFKNFINTCEQTFSMKYFDYHATQGKLFEKLALLWAVWGKEHLSTEVKEGDLKKEFDNYTKNISACDVQFQPFTHLYNCAKHFFELGLTAEKGE